jgi:hypothetical protein
MAQSTALPAATTRENLAGDPFAQLRARVEQLQQQFQASPPTPAAAYTLETELKAALDEAGRALLREALDRCEPAAKDQAAPRVRYHK